ncbi:unnamed protein product [Caenorhabditis sp. 36 PRJEB53466]|nr:unnamed protein product [Caenorhabditis sp. 36 PRJEB53466]
MFSVTVPRCTPFQGEEWAAYGQTVEQQVAGEGRRLQPTLQYSLEKLDMVQKYKVQLKVEQVGEHKYKFNEMAAQIVEHPDGWKTGMEWMDETVNFSKLYITNKPGCTNKLHVFVNPQRKYTVTFVLISESGLHYTEHHEAHTFVVVSNHSQQFKAKKAELKAAKRAENPSRAQKRPSERTAEPKRKQMKVCADESEQAQGQQQQQAPSEVDEDELVPEDQEGDNVEWVQVDEDDLVPDDQVFYEYPVEQQEHWEVVPQEPRATAMEQPSGERGERGPTPACSQQPHQWVTHPQGANVIPSQVSANAPFQNNWHMDHHYQHRHHGYQVQYGNVEIQPMPTAPATNSQWNQAPN